MWQEQMELEGPYNFDRVIERHAIDPLNQVDLQKRLIKVPILIDKNRYVVEVVGLGTIHNPVFKLTGKNTEQKEAQIKSISEIFQWNIPLKNINQHFLKTDLSGLFQEHFGTPLILDFDLFSCITKCIIHQQLNLSFAHTLTERFVKTYGTEIEGVWFYPKPETVAAITVEQLRELQFSGRKAEYVIGLGKLVAEGALDLEALSRKSEEGIFNQLIKIRGIGAWTIQNFLLFGLGRPNLFPATDIGIQNALKKLYHLERKPTLEEIERYKHGWEPYLSYASLYLWRSIE
ncbi:MAG TPA: DNA-3-methyladenine glycosylase 2 family protein [Bacillus bacterium]|nr:DNA-3-methyladenine glycosylase 2 family protein [Bacillus sp. (in: firmicutes)]